MLHESVPPPKRLVSNLSVSLAATIYHAIVVESSDLGRSHRLRPARSFLLCGSEKKKNSRVYVSRELRLPQTLKGVKGIKERLLQFYSPQSSEILSWLEESRCARAQLDTPCPLYTLSRFLCLSRKL